MLQYAPAAALPLGLHPPLRPRAQQRPHRVPAGHAHQGQPRLQAAACARVLRRGFACALCAAPSSAPLCLVPPRALCPSAAHIGRCTRAWRSRFPKAACARHATGQARPRHATRPHAPSRTVPPELRVCAPPLRVLLPVRRRRPAHHASWGTQCERSRAPARLLDVQPDMVP